MTEFSTFDTYFAAYLRTAGVTLIRMERGKEHKRRVFMIFEDDGSTIAALKDGWINGTSQIPARLYTENLKSLHASIDLV